MYSWTRRILYIVLSTIVISCFLVNWLHRSISHKHIAQDINIRNRVANMNRMCNKLGYNGYIPQNYHFLSSILVDDKHKFLFCIVKKAASRHFKSLFLSLSKISMQSNLTKSKDKSDLTFLDSLSPTEVDYRLNNYNKVIFVRNPLERLVSAFKCKFIQTSESENAKNRVNKIINRYRNNSFERSLEKRYVKFTEFIHFLVDNVKKGTNAHWRPFSDHCHPCFIRYNYIGKLETLEEDLNGFLKSLDIKDNVIFRGMNTMHGKTSEMMAEFYKTVQPEMFKRLINIYSEDFVLFDYVIPTQEQIIHRLV